MGANTSVSLRSSQLHGLIFSPTNTLGVELGRQKIKIVHKAQHVCVCMYVHVCVSKHTLYACMYIFMQCVCENGNIIERVSKLMLFNENPCDICSVALSVPHHHPKRCESVTATV